MQLWLVIPVYVTQGETETKFVLFEPSDETSTVIYINNNMSPQEQFKILLQFVKELTNTHSIRINYSVKVDTREYTTHYKRKENGKN